MNTLHLTDDQLSDVIHALRGTAEADATRVTQLKVMGMAQFAPPFETQSARFATLADSIEDGELSG